ncbi:hypothetical protein DL96DRAFT_1491150 [Flagelloscypha sp. PMI_526]|nr:hypothetical protein DL96DRAFT_1491150 [Flagelloscypha sp. PMI_526]
MSEDTSLQQEATSSTSDTFKTALVFNAAVFGIELVLFTLLRPYFKSIYEPRTFAPPKSKRVQSLGSSYFGWILSIFRSNPEDIIPGNGLDAYFYVRFLRMCLKIFGPIWIVSWAVLMPITSVKSRVGNNSGLDLFVFGNVRKDQQERYAAHLILAWFFTFYILYVIRGELSHFVYKRQLFLISPQHAKTVMANTVLITGIPGPYQSVEKLTRLFKDVPGGVKQVWLNRNLKDIPDIYDRQVAATNKLEKAETTLLSAAAKAKFKGEKSTGKTQDPEKGSADSSYLPQGDERPHHKLGFLGLFGEKVDTIEWARKEIKETREELEKKRHIIWGGNAPWEEAQHVQEETLAAQAETSADPGHEKGTDDADLDHADLETNVTGRPPTEKKGLFGAVGGVGHRVGGTVKGALDLEAGKEGLEGENAEGRKNVGTRLKTVAGVVPIVGDIVNKDTSGEDEYPLLNSAFVTFNRQIGAHMAGQVLLHSGPYRMTGKYLETAPADVIWSNLGMDPYAMKIRFAVSWALTIGLIATWAIPVAFVGVISNIHSVCKQEPWLAWLCTLPAPVVGIIQGILPPVLLAVLFMLLPIVLRLFAKFEGIPKMTAVELSLMSRYFIFQVIHGFLVVSLSSGLLASLPEIIKTPGNVPTILATNLPKASTFFLSYVILQGLSGAAGGFLMIVPLIVYYVKLFILGSTPRSVFGIKFGARGVSWGTLFPNTTLIVVISIGYMIISPIINGLAFATFFLFYMLYKFLFLWVFQQPQSSDTGGLFFPKAIQHVLTGVYIQQICLAALFFLSRDDQGKVSALPEGILMIVLVVFTVGVHIIFNNSYAPLYYALPLSLSDKTYTPPAPTNSESQEGIVTESAQIQDTYERLDDEKYGYAHPCVSRPQRIIWIPEDDMGLWKGEVEGCRKDGVLADLGGGAKMNAKGKVDVEGPGPGEEYE